MPTCRFNGASSATQGRLPPSSTTMPVRTARAIVVKGGTEHSSGLASQRKRSLLLQTRLGLRMPDRPAPFVPIVTDFRFHFLRCFIKPPCGTLLQVSPHLLGHLCSTQVDIGSFIAHREQEFC